MSKKKIAIATILFAGLTLSCGIFTVNKVNAFAPICKSLDINADGIEDASRCAINLSAISPYDGETGVPVGATLSLTTANPSVTASTGNLYIVETGVGVHSTIPCASLTKVANTFSTVMALAINTNYHINLVNCFSDPSISIPMSDTTTWNFSTSSGPVLISSVPSDGQSGVDFNIGATLNFDQPVRISPADDGGVVSLNCGGENVFTKPCIASTFDGAGTATLRTSFGHVQNAGQCDLHINNQCIENMSGVKWTGADINFSTSNTNNTSGICTFVEGPLDDATNVPINTNFNLDAIEKFIRIYGTAGYPDLLNPTLEVRETATTNLVAAYNININTSPEVDGIGTSDLTIDPTTNLLPATSYYININNVVLENCPNVNIADTVTWNFTTAAAGTPILVSKLPRNNRVNVSVDTPLIVEYTAPLSRGVGSVRVYQTDGEVLIDTIPAASGRIYGIGTNTVRIFPINGLVDKTDYHIIMDEGFLNGGSPTTPVKAISFMEWFWRTKYRPDIPFFRDWTDERP